jgi:hypothetical protein
MHARLFSNAGAGLCLFVAALSILFGLTTLPSGLQFSALQAEAAPVWGTVTPAAPPLPGPSGNVVRVSSVAALQAAVQALSSNTTIVIAPGTYTLTSTLWVNGPLSNVTIRGESNRPDDAVLVGTGMGVPSGGVPHGIWSGNGVTGLTIANLTIRDVWQHPIIFNPGTESPRVYNVRLVNAGEQFIKASTDGSGDGVDDGIVEYSIFEYTDTAPTYYTNGVDVLAGRDWIVRHNLFRRLRAPQGQLAGPAILMWYASSGTIAEGNVFLDCQRDISFGLVERTPNDHSGGIIRNNVIVRTAGLSGDVAIGVFDSPGTTVLHNTVLMSGQYPNAIEYRFPHTTGVTIVNNLGDAGAQARDGGVAALSGNVWTAAANWFVQPAAGDLHLRSTATAAIDRGVPTSDAPRDWDNEIRPIGPAADVGADEYRLFDPPVPVPDETAPVVVVTSPANGTVVGGTVTVSATASDNVGVTGVRFVLDGMLLGSEDTTAPYQTTWATTSAPNGSSHALLAIATDAVGNTTSSGSVTVTVSNPAGDTAAPTVEITGPLAGATVSRTVTVSAAAADNVGVVGVRFTLDGLTIGAEDLSAPYQVSWNTAGVANGSHVLRAMARDAAGNVTTSDPVAVEVKNSRARPRRRLD